MRVGIVSIHSAHNYGSLLQAYALQETLKKYSNDVQIINYRPKYLDCQYSMFSVQIYKKYHGLINKILHLGWRIIMVKKRYEKYVKFESFIKNEYNLTKKYTNFNDLCKDNLNYDVVFCGSDQIWNTDITEGFDKVFYLGFLNNDVKKASYAASIGRQEIDKRYYDNYKESINKFDYISIREESSEKLMRAITNKKININLDPTLLLEKEKWHSLISKSNIKLKGNDYIFVYILQDNSEFVKIVNKLSEVLNMRVISVSKKKRFKNETIYPNAGVEDFLFLCSNSKFVVTNSFHGTVFSIIFEKNNCIIPHLNTGNRMIDLMNSVGLSKRVIKEYNDLNVADIIKDVDYKSVNKKLSANRKKSFDYFKEVLHEKK